MLYMETRRLPIVIFDDYSEEEDRLGIQFDKNFRMASLEFSNVDCFYPNDQIEEQVGVRLIHFFIKGVEFCTPLTDENAEILKSALS